MPLVPIDDDGNVLEYEDSGAPPGSTDYTTLFCFNNFLWHSGVFRPLFPHAATYNFRVIAIHPREYCRSSPYTDDELAALQSGDQDDEANIIRQEGHAMAVVIAHVIKNDGLPLPSESGGVKTGGVIIIARSAGVALLAALLGNLDSLDKEVYALLDQYVTCCIMLDPPGMIFGIAEPTGSIHPLKDVSLSPEQATKDFIDWTVSYHEPISDLNLVTAETILTRKSLSATSSDPRYTPTRMNEQDLKELTCPEVASRLGPLFMNWEVSMANTRRTFLNTGGAWKNVKIIITWADSVFWTAIWGVKGITDLLEEPAEKGAERRDVRFVRVDNANGWFFYDHPEQFLQFVAESK
ncbi:hypothetical protein BC835DRAFT_1537220 [Cytidiella melzeri]|nr:hypothetical protein BC835DRAFT_1537220 [Cytidiella melzeri]